MKYRVRQYVTLFLLVSLTGLSGCYFRIPSEDSRDMVEYSQEYYNTTTKYIEEQHEEKNAYAQEFEQAHDWLRRAEEELNKQPPDSNEAFWAAVKSSALSRQIIDQAHTMYAITSEEAQKIIDETQKNYKEVEYVEKKVGDQKKYSQEIETAQTWLARAQTHVKNKQFNEAVLSAVKSNVTSQQILTRFYAEDFPGYIERLKADIKSSRLMEDPENPATDFLRQLDAILANTKEVSENTELVYLDKVIDFQNARRIEETMVTVMTKTVESDVSFGSGQYILSAAGKEDLQDFINKTLESKESFTTQYPAETVTIKIKTVGYTDKVWVRPWTPLYQELIASVEEQVPTDDTRWTFFNQRLSEFRAREIGGYIKQQILESDPENPLIQIELEPIGNGQAIPPGVEPPYPTDDPRRRICKIYSYVTLDW